MEFDIQLLPNLKDVEAYQNEVVVLRFCDHFNLQVAEADDIFTETKKWLWLCATARVERKYAVDGVPDKLAIDSSLLIIDEMWHNFLCFTKEYMSFCSRFFGFFVHHYPTPRVFNDELRSAMAVDPEIQVNRRRVQYSYIYDKLGHQTFVKWYEEYAEEYTEERIKSIRLK